MQPFVPSFPCHNNQIQTNGYNGSTPQQAMLSNPCLANPANLGSNHQSHCCSCTCHNAASRNPSQIHSQLHAVTPQFPIVLNNSHTHLSNINQDVQAGPNRPPLIPSTCFMNAQNHHFPVQNSHGGMPLMGSSAPHHPHQPHGQFCSQNNIRNMSPIATSPARGPFFNLPQGQSFLHNLPQMMTHNRPLQPHLYVNMPNGQFSSNNLPAHLNQTTDFSHGQFYSQNPMQYMNQPVSMAYGQYGVSPTQLVPNNTLPCSHPLQYTNQLSQTLGTQNPALLMNPQLDLVNQREVLETNSQDSNPSIPPGMGNNSLQQSPIAAQQLQGNFISSHTCGPVQMQQTQMNLQPSGSEQLQGNHANDGDHNITNQRYPPSKTETRNNHNYGKKEIANPRSHKIQFHHKTIAEGNKRSFHGKREKGNRNERAIKSQLANVTGQTGKESRRSLPLNYTEQEVQLWREARRKNYPSKATIEKKLSGKQTKPDVIDEDAKTRRKELREILEKQAALGVEVAEIPPNYLLETENHLPKGEEEQRVWNKNGKFQNKNGKRGRNARARFAKKQKLGENNSFTAPSLDKKKLTLLQKLLSKDLKRDKTHILQVFRFMVMNSFFKNGSGKQLEFPVITGKGVESDIDVKPTLHQSNNSISGVGKNAIIEVPKSHSMENDDDFDEDDDGCEDEEMTYEDGKAVDCIVKEEMIKSEAEEGEITD